MEFETLFESVAVIEHSLVTALESVRLLQTMLKCGSGCVVSANVGTESAIAVTTPPDNPVVVVEESVVVVEESVKPPKRKRHRSTLVEGMPVVLDAYVLQCGDQVVGGTGLARVHRQSSTSVSKDRIYRALCRAVPNEEGQLFVDIEDTRCAQLAKGTDWPSLFPGKTITRL